MNLSQLVSSCCVAQGSHPPHCYWNNFQCLIGKDVRLTSSCRGLGYFIVLWALICRWNRGFSEHHYPGWRGGRKPGGHCQHGFHPACDLNESALLSHPTVPAVRYSKKRNKNTHMSDSISKCLEAHSITWFWLLKAHFVLLKDQFSLFRHSSTTCNYNKISLQHVVTIKYHYNMCNNQN